MTKEKIEENKEDENIVIKTIKEEYEKKVQELEEKHKEELKELEKKLEEKHASQIRTLFLGGAPTSGQEDKQEDDDKTFYERVEIKLKKKLKIGD